MTVNIGLVTSDAVILGCDSVASTTAHYVNPFELDWDRGSDGDVTKGADGKFRLAFDFKDLQPIVTNSWGGVTKLFEIHSAPSPMFAVTAGLAKLKERPIASWAAEFCEIQKSRQQSLVNLDVIAPHFLRFVRQKYDDHYDGSNLPDSLKEGPEFLVGGFGRDDEFPSLYRLDVQNNRMRKEFGAGASATGTAWNGQADAVERFIRGYDGVAKETISDKIASELKNHNTAVTTYMIETINAVLDKLKQPMPDGINIAVPELKEITLDWEHFRVDLDYANLPLQDAVNFVAFLVNVQGGKSLFARGVPTVGGRTHIGIITKDKGIRILNEPELTHQYVGFTYDR
ncbi:MAG TPA: hypothetical protein VMV19_06000 [Xanthobacteraceae bacterium]|nr:hypothetical protein [Xanthobacteraceae bacterium]